MSLWYQGDLYPAGDFPGSILPGQLITLGMTSILAGATFNWDFDVSDLPDNALVNIGFALSGFRVNAPAGGAFMQGNGSFGAYRDVAGGLRSSASAWSGFGWAVATVGSVITIGNVVVVNPNTLRLEVVADVGGDVRMIGRAMRTYVQSPLPVEAP